LALVRKMEMDSKQGVTEVVRVLCKNALDATLKLRDLFRLWPKEANTDPFYRQVYEDLEDGVEHTPGFLLRKGIDHRSWLESDMYLTLYIDSVLLSYKRSSAELLHCREILLSSGISNKEAIENKIRECLKATGQKGDRHLLLE
jgi:hypothetical protein